MAQSHDALKAAFDRMTQLAERRTWLPCEPSLIELRLTSMDPPSAVSFDSVAGFVAHARQELGIDFSLVGGGYGCFDLGFTADGPNSAALEGAFANDSEFLRRLNVLRVHTARVKTPIGRQAYCAFYDMKVAVATNRTPQTAILDGEWGVTGAFGNTLSKTTHYGLAHVSVVDLTQGQRQESMSRRVWHAATLGLFRNRREQPRRAVLRKLDPLDDAKFAQQVGALSRRGALVNLHGYANDFDDALRSCALTSYMARLEQLERLPILFSWPSGSSTVKYFSDTKQAENSERPFLDVLHLVASATTGKDLDVLAHSHGNHVLVSALSDKRCTIAKTPLKRLILVEPDVDQTFFEQRVGDVLLASQHVALYHSRNDRALWLASKLFSSVRAGRAGLSKEGMEAVVVEKLEVIDASLVATGLSKHAPHVESPEVIRDIHDVLEGTPPLKRFGVRATSDAGYWEMIPPR